jgi:hypothetical protein
MRVAVFRILGLALLFAADASAQQPPATAPPPPPAPAPPAGNSLDDLQKEYEKIRESLFTARARAAAVSSAVYSSRVQVFLKYASPRFFSVSRSTVRLDGAAVFEDTTNAISNDNVMRWGGFVAPGKHEDSIRIEAEAKDDSSFTTATENTFTIDVPARREVTLRASAEDAGDMGYSWGKKTKGSYKLRLDVGVEGKNLDAAAKP